MIKTVICLSRDGYLHQRDCIFTFQWWEIARMRLPYYLHALGKVVF